MHKKAKITYPRFKGIPAVLTAQGFHKGRLDCVEVSVLRCLDGIVINVSSRDVFHRRRLALPSDSPLLSLLNSYTLLSPSNNSSTKEEKQDKSRTEEETKTQIQILLRVAFGTFKGEVPYYSARNMGFPEELVPGL